MRAFSVHMVDAVHDKFPGVFLTADIVAALARSLEERYEDGGLVEATVEITPGLNNTLRIAAEGIYNPLYSFSVATTVADLGDVVVGPIDWR